MSESGGHLPSDRLVALACEPAGALSSGAADDAARDHLDRCQSCAREFGRIASGMAALRSEAHREADAWFDDAALVNQRRRILDRLARAGQAARVLAFPGFDRRADRPAPVSARRWVSVAAAAGLILGLVAGQMIHVLPIDVAHRAPAPVDRPSDVARIDAPKPPLTDEELLGVLDDDGIHAVELRALHELTPVAFAEIR